MMLATHALVTLVNPSPQIHANTLIRRVLVVQLAR